MNTPSAAARSKKSGRSMGAERTPRTAAGRWVVLSARTDAHHQVPALRATRLRPGAALRLLRQAHLGPGRDRGGEPRAHAAVDVQRRRRSPAEEEAELRR